MNRRISFIAALGLLFASSIAGAQAPEPAARAAAQPAPPPLFAPGQPRDVVVEAIIDANPQTPRELLRAAATLAEAGRPDVAKPYLQRILAANLDEAALAKLASQFEPNELMRVAANPELAPEGRQVADAVLTAAARRARDPQHIIASLEKLSRPSLAGQREALAEVFASGPAAVPTIVDVLSKPDRARLHAAARLALVQLGRQAAAPLAAALETNDPALKIQIIDVVAEIGSPDAVVYLAAPATDPNIAPKVRVAAQRAIARLSGVADPTLSDAVKLLQAEIARYWQREKLPPPHDVDGQVDLWRWDAATGTLVREKLPAEQAGPVLATRVARDLIRLAPDDRQAQRMYLICALKAASDRVGIDNPLPQDAGGAFDEAKQLGPEVVEDTLAYALSTGHRAAAMRAVQILGAIGDRSMLDSKDATARPLVQALVQGDRRLRLAAASAIMGFGPTTDFAGSSDLVKSLVFFGSSPGQRRALVAFPNTAIAGQLAALLRPLGYEVDIATNGRRAFLDAISSGDYELVLLSGRIDRPPVYVVLQEMRHNPNSAIVPVGLLGEPGDTAYLESVKSDDPLTAVFERPYAEAGMKFYVDRLMQQAGRGLVSSDLRSQQASAALAWLKQLNEASSLYFDIRPYEKQIARSLHSPDHSAAAAELLALIGTHTAQRALVEMASTPTWPLDMRRSAAASFSASVRRYGIMLTTDEIRRQYERYNHSAIEDAATQKLLGLILDAIERPTADARQKPEDRSQKDQGQPRAA